MFRRSRGETDQSPTPDPTDEEQESVSPVWQLRLSRIDRERPLHDPPRVMVMTMVRDEAVMLPRWLRFYGEQVGYEHLLVLDDQTSDGSTDDLPCTVIKLPELPGEREYESSRMDLASAFAAGFLAVYDFVVFVDADEFLVPDPARYDGLLAFLAERGDRTAIAGIGLNVLHHVGTEPPLRADEPVLGQRHYAKYVPLMCKPSIKRIAAAWRHSSHGLMAPFEVDPELYLVHLKFADRDAMLAMAARRRAVVEADGRAGNSNWKTTPEELEQQLSEWVAGYDPDTVPEFDPASVDLAAAVVRGKGGGYKTARPGQLGAMQKHPLVRVPERLFGRV